AGIFFVSQELHETMQRMHITKRKRWIIAK
ncbi:MAG: hypothetical protein ACI828_000918, partial [Flavobacteriales bacterium]